MNMFCYQCEQTARGTGCTVQGVCGKDGETAVLQDLLVFAAKEIARYAHRARLQGEKDRVIDRFILEALFTTVTNVNFDPERVITMIYMATDIREKAIKMYESACAKNKRIQEKMESPVAWSRSDNRSSLLEKGKITGIAAQKERLGDDIAGLRELLLYGLKGMAAYADHAMILGYEDEDVYSFFHEALDFLTRDDAPVEDLLTMCLKCGEINLKVMGMLDKAHTDTFGHPRPTQVRIHPVKGKAILVSGHDLKDLEELLKQTEGKGINIYTHGEMLPAHGYPGLNKYTHLAGNYGGAWQDQRREFAEFPGAILMTTNCIQKPADSYKNRIFTCGLAAWPGVTHIKNRDFSPVINAALEEKGFEEDGPDDAITVGFGHNTVINIADRVVSAVRSGDVHHFFLIGGCDGAKPGRNYYTEFARAVPKDCIILTLACGKYRFNKMDFGDIGGIPRLLDMGQCNDAYSAIQIALALSGAFEMEVNQLPLSLILSWYEQKAVCILLSLLSLGIKNIRLGPSLPAFITAPVLKVLVEKFDLKPITTPKEDLKAILG
jgi:hydroxylamine reductase